MLEDALCLMCWSTEEDALYAVVSCQGGQNLWAEACLSVSLNDVPSFGLWWKVSLNEVPSFGLWWKEVASKVLKEKLCIITAPCRKIWGMRNEWVWKRRCRTSLRNGEFFLKVWHSTHECNQIRKQQLKR